MQECTARYTYQVVLSFIVIFFHPHLVYRPTVTLSANPPGALNPTSSVTFTCEATYDFQLNRLIDWVGWQPPRHIVDDLRKYYSVGSVSGMRYTSNLTIYNVENRDEGEYMCRARTGYGTTVTKHILLSVLGKYLTIILILPYYSLHKRDKATIL